MYRNLSAVILFVVTITGCTIYKEFPIDIYVPGDIQVPPDAKNVTLIYRNFSYTGDTLQNYYKSDHQLKRVRNPKENRDSILVVACLNELAGELKTNHVFDKITVLPVDLFKKHKADKLPPLNFELISRLPLSSESDILISLETYSSFFSEFSGNYDVAESNEVVTASVWAVFDLANKRITNIKTIIDTTYWNRIDVNEGRKSLPPRETALKIASQLAGRNYAKHFFASWQTVERMYIVPPLPDFSEAASLISEGEWDKAISIWEKYASEKNGKLAISARYNIALAYEMKDDFPNAMNWLNGAEKLAVSYKNREDIIMILEYKKVLDQRIKQFNRLQTQSYPNAN